MQNLFRLLFQRGIALRRRFGAFVRTVQARSAAQMGRSVFSHEGQVISRRETSAVQIGDHCHIRGELLVFPHAGQIVLGDWVYVGPGSTIWSSSVGGVTIGNRVLISQNVHIHDTDSHPIDAAQRFAQTQAIMTTGHPRDITTIDAKPVRIGDDAWIGLNAVILKGVTIGQGAIIGACSVVTRDVPPYCTVVGNPARVVKSGTSPKSEI